MREPANRTMGLGLALAVGLALAATPAVGQEQSGEMAQAQQARTIQMKVLGLSCPFCAYGVEQKVKRLEGVEDLDVQLESGIATITLEEGADISNETLRRTVDEAGFEAAAIVRSFESEHEDVNPEEIPREAPSGTGSAGASA